MRITLDNFTLSVPLSAGRHDILGQRLHLEPGECIMVVAPSSRGKTSLIHSLYGTRTDWRGDLFFDARSVRSLRPRDWAELRRRQLAVVFQDLRLFPAATVRENIMINAALTPDNAADTLVEDSIELGIGNTLDRPCRELSLGEQQRVALLRALVQPFDWLFLDEPFSHLDTASAASAAAMIRRRCQRLGAGVVLTSLTLEGPLTPDRRLEL